MCAFFLKNIQHSGEDVFVAVVVIVVVVVVVVAVIVVVVVVVVVVCQYGRCILNHCLYIL